MARYKIEIKFNGDPTTGSKIQIDSPSGVRIFDFEFYKAGETAPALNPVQYVVGIKEATNYNFREAFRIGYNTGAAWVVTYGSQLTFIEGEFDSLPVLATSLPPNVTWSITEIASPIYITDTEFFKNVGNTCNKIDVLITADIPFNELVSPYAASFADTLTYTAESLNRNVYVTVSIRNSDGSFRAKQIQTPSYLNIGLIGLNIANNTLIVEDLGTWGLDLQYSLNGIDYQVEPVFNNLSAAIYTLYVKDQYDCEIQTVFEIREWDNGEITLPPEPYFEYPKSNCLRMAKRENWDNVSIFKNSENTLSCEVTDGIPYTEKQSYNNSDIIPIQVKTNYSDLKIITSDDDVEQAISQRTANMNVKSSMDGKIVSLGSNAFGVYFISGKTYDYDTDADLLEDYSLNGQLPQFAKVGNIIEIDGFKYAIDSLTFNQDLEVDQIVIYSTVLTDGLDKIVKSQYNVFTYEVYETDIDMSGRDTLNVEIWYDGIMQWSSELIVANNEGGKLLHLKWWHKHNTDMYFASGIQPFMRRLVATRTAAPKNESKNYETDSDVIQIESDNYEADSFLFEPMTKELAKLTVLALSHSTVEINGISYIKEGSPEMESLDESNLYVVTAKMVVKGSGLYEEETDLANTEIPALLIDDLGGYIKIE